MAALSLIVILVNFGVIEKEVVYLHPFLWADGALIASKDVLSVGMADHRIDEGVGNAMPSEGGDVGVSGGGRSDGTDAKFGANVFHALADGRIEIVDAVCYLRFGLGAQQYLRKDKRSHDRG